MLSFYIKGGMEESREFLANLKASQIFSNFFLPFDEQTKISEYFQIFTLAESLGGFESLVELPAVMTHASVPASEREKLGITDNLIRVSVGIEDVEDLIQDLDQALKKVINIVQWNTLKNLEEYWNFCFMLVSLSYFRLVKHSDMSFVLNNKYRLIGTVIQTSFSN